MSYYGRRAAAAGGGVAGVGLQPLPVGYYFGPQSGPAPGASGALEAGRIYLVPVPVHTAITLDRIGLEVINAVAANTIRLGMYSSVGDLPAALLLDAGTINAATAGYKEINISQAVPAGVLWLAHLVPAGGSGALTVRSVEAPFAVDTVGGTLTIYARGYIRTSATSHSVLPASLLSSDLITANGATNQMGRVLVRRSA